MSKQGSWVLYKFSEGKWEELHEIQAAIDCDGHFLWDDMKENGLIDDWASYDTDAEEGFFVAMSKVDGLPDFRWEFQYREESESDVVKRLIKVAKQVASRASIANDDNDELACALEQAIEDAELLFEDTTPRSMGWVGDDGLP